MVDIKYIRENPEKVKEACRNKQVDCDVDRILQLDQNIRDILPEKENLRAAQKRLGRDEIEKATRLKQEIKGFEEHLKGMQEELSALLLEVPNVPLPDVPVGKDDTENKVIKTWGKVPQFDFTPKDHIFLGQDLDLINIEKASTITGERF